MAWAGPSKSFKAFEDEVNRFKISPTGLDLRFDAKQRMIARAEGFAVREAYLLTWPQMLGPGVRRYLAERIRECDEKIASAEAAATHPVEVVSEDDARHRSEICLNLYGRTVQQIILRRLYTVSAVAAVAAFVAAVVAVVVTAFK